MQIRSHDYSCRYLPAIGTDTDASNFGTHLKALGVRLPRALPLSELVAKGWLVPALRVVLPPAPFLCWEDYPNLSMQGTDKCPEDQEWVLQLHVRATSGLPPRRTAEWWIHFLDDAADPLSQQARAHAVVVGTALPKPFRHERFNQLIRPWIDYFAYWQAFHLAEILKAVTASTILTGDLCDTIGRHWTARKERAAERIQRLNLTWLERGKVFDWLSRMRTALGASVLAERSWSDVRTALRTIASTSGLTPDKMKADIRDVLLVMWHDWTSEHPPVTRSAPLLEAIREEIQYGIAFLEAITGTPVDFLDPYWHDERQSNEWSNLLEALPEEQELARQAFPRTALQYTKDFAKALPSLVGASQESIRALVSAHWETNRPLRRFVLAVYRLHAELEGEKLMASEALIRSTERIEQFNLVMMNAERVLRGPSKKRTGDKHQDVRELAKDTLNHVLGRWSLHGGGVGVAARKRIHELLVERAQLHEIERNKDLRLVTPAEVKSGNDAADNAVAALTNLVIARNYAAHHDVLDMELTYPATAPLAVHPGALALSSAIATVLVVVKED